MPTMAVNKLPSGIVKSHQVLQRMAALDNPTQRPTSNPAPDAEFINQLGSALQDLKTVLQTVTGSVFKYQRREKRLRPVQASNLRGVTMANSAVPIAVSWKLDCPSVEALLDKNPRTVVPPEEIVTGRPQHAVVKVVACFSDGTATGSGVLINENIVATAAHLVMDDSGHAKSVTVRAGLGGIDNTIESRKGTYTAVHHKWFNEGSPLNDLAFIRLSKPFDTVKPISYKQTPDTDTGIAANIYGFPYDMPSFAKGNRLCVSKGLVRYSQTCSTGMVEHDGDSVEGTSGGGVIDADGTLIALHRGWDIKDNREKINVAVPIDRESNIFKTFCEILDVMSRSGDISVNMPDDVTVEGFTFS